MIGHRSLNNLPDARTKENQMSFEYQKIVLMNLLLADFEYIQGGPLFERYSMVNTMCLSSIQPVQFAQQPLSDKFIGIVTPTERGKDLPDATSH